MGFPRSFGLLLLLFLSSQALAQSSRSRIDGTVGAGVLQFSVTNPSADFKISNSTNFVLQAEKPFGSSPLFLTVGLNYFKSTGQINYSYTGASATYTQQNVSFTADDFQISVGLRVKAFESSFLHPFIEGGGFGGYLQLVYNGLNTAAFSLQGSDYKTIDNTLEFGYYGEAGLELQPEGNWGVRASYRYTNSTTRSITTLKNQSVNYIGNIYYAGLFWHF